MLCISLHQLPLKKNGRPKGQSIAQTLVVSRIVYLLRKLNPDVIIRRVRENEEIASEKGVPSWIAFSNVKLLELARDCPTDEARLYEISGIRLKKLEQCGEAFVSERL